MKYYLSPLILVLVLTMVDPATARPLKDIPQKGSRLFSIAVTPPEVKDINNFWKTYEEAFDLAIKTGIDVPGELVFNWSDVEHKSFFGSISYQDNQFLRVIEIFKKRNIPVIITIAPFETMNHRIPEDLLDLPLDHPKVINRFKKFIDWVYKATRELEVMTVVLGNEFDLYLTFEAAKGNNKWKAFESMVANTRDYVKSKPRWKHLPFTLEPTYGGLVGKDWQTLQKINKHADIIGVSYYPLQETSVHEPVILGKHLQDLFRIYPNKKIDFYQYGYPSSTKLNSSLEKQRQFIVETFKQWDQYKDKIRLITFTWLYDVQEIHIDQMGDDTLGELSANQAFIEFLGTLGLHGRKVGEEKPAFKELKKQLKLRGWP